MFEFLAEFVGRITWQIRWAFRPGTRRYRVRRRPATRATTGFGEPFAFETDRYICPGEKVVQDRLRKIDRRLFLRPKTFDIFP